MEKHINIVLIFQLIQISQNDENFHGAAVSRDRLGEALNELGVENNLDELLERRKAGPPEAYNIMTKAYPDVKAGEQIQYSVTDKKDNRSAFGNALVSNFSHSQQNLIYYNVCFLSWCS